MTCYFIKINDHMMNKIFIKKIKINDNEINLKINLNEDIIHKELIYPNQGFNNTDLIIKFEKEF